MVTLIHRHNAQMWQVRGTACSHFMIRQVYRDCSGVQQTNWRRVPKATVEQLKRECVSVEKLTAPFGAASTVTPPEPTRTANS